MKKQKTRKELKENIEETTIALIIFIGVFVFVLCFMFGYYNDKVDLKQRLQACIDYKEKVPETDKMQRVCCYYLDKIEVCWDTELYFGKGLPINCEVLE